MPGPIDVVIAAAGSGRRLGADYPKAFVEVDGVSLLRRCLVTVAALGARRIVVTVPPGDAETWIERAVQLAEGLAGGLTKGLPGGPAEALAVHAVAGGETRQASVRNGLLALRELGSGVGGDDPGGVVLVHDAARPCASLDLWIRVAAEAERSGAAVPVLPSVDSLKEVDDTGTVVASVDRARIMRVQTPQGFRFADLLDAHLAAQASRTERTDDAALFEFAGRRVATVPGEEANVKVTNPEDLARVARSSPGSTPRLRVGYGYDIHPLVEGRRLVLGGVEIEYRLGLDGHSDADALAHAVIDALLGAAGLGDIGQRFPADEARWKDADSLELLAAVVADLAGAGLVPHNVDATVLAEHPRLLPHLSEMRRRLAERLGISEQAVNVKATRGEGMGPIGRGEGIAAHAVATVAKA